MLLRLTTFDSLIQFGLRENCQNAIMIGSAHVQAGCACTAVMAMVAKVTN